MFSRLALRPALQCRVLQPSSVRSTTTASAGKESDERDLVNFPRPERLENPGKVRLGFLPDEWFQFFYKKTGVTGPYVFGTGLITYLCSKEIYVMEHEFYSGISLLIMIVYGVKKFGPTIAAYLDKEIDAVEADYNSTRENAKKSLADAIEDEKKEQWRAEGQAMLFEAKKENVGLQLEAAYRERIMTVFSQVKRRLDYQVERENIMRRLSQKNMVSWVVDGVMKSITPQQEKESLQKCILDLKSLAAKA
ncbi:ATP synthase subunit b, mitochondrial [Ischnura elegans]|uniref:ATP synthase subunit b, mitochondrial n=1 Tax=Ischnura elegans TaxID=197161 RepID=UPI001ED8689F|nr:ATP synthase subunit b, mitochondrial [Ischnura elegans]